MLIDVEDLLISPGAEHAPRVAYFSAAAYLSAREYSPGRYEPYIRFVFSSRRLTYVA